MDPVSGHRFSLRKAQPINSLTWRVIEGEAYIMTAMKENVVTQVKQVKLRANTCRNRTFA